MNKKILLSAIIFGIMSFGFLFFPDIVSAACGSSATTYTVNATAPADWGANRCNPAAAIVAVSGYPSTFPSVPGSVSRWKCGTLTTICEASKASAVAGVCNTVVAKTYAVNDTTFAAGAKCTTGTVSPASPSFPTIPGTSTTYKCNGNWTGGTTDDVTCTVKKTAATPGVCGPGAKIYSATDTSFTTPLCSTGARQDVNPNPLTFPGYGQTVSWKCLDNWTAGSVADASCTASRQAAAPVCNSSTPCSSTFGTKVCRSIDGGAYAWIDPPSCGESNFCQKYTCNGETGFCDANTSSFSWMLSSSSRCPGGNTSLSNYPYSISFTRVGNPYCIGKSADTVTQGNLPGAVLGIKYDMKKVSGPCSEGGGSGYYNNNASFDFTKTLLGTPVYQYKYEWHDLSGNPIGYITADKCGCGLEYKPNSFSTTRYVGKIFAPSDNWSVDCVDCSSCPICYNYNGGVAPKVDLTGPTTVNINQSFNLSWTTTNSPDFCTASGDWSGAKIASGGIKTIAGFATAGAKTFTITCTKAGYSDATDTVTVNIVDNKLTLNFYADSYKVDYNTATTLHWTATNANTCEAKGVPTSWTGIKSNTTGSEPTGNLTTPSTYNLECSNGTETISKAVNIAVGAQPPSPSSYVCRNMCTSSTCGQTVPERCVNETGTKVDDNIFTCNGCNPSRVCPACDDSSWEEVAP